MKIGSSQNSQINKCDTTFGNVSFVVSICWITKERWELYYAWQTVPKPNGISYSRLLRFVTMVTGLASVPDWNKQRNGS